MSLSTKCLEIDDNNVYLLKVINVDKLLNSKFIIENKFYSIILRSINKFLFYSYNSLPEVSIYFWRLAALRKALEIYKDEPYEIVYTSSGPVSPAIVGNRLKSKLGIKWIPEFRDLWTLNHYSRYNRCRKFST